MEYIVKKHIMEYKTDVVGAEIESGCVVAFVISNIEPGGAPAFGRNADYTERLEIKIVSKITKNRIYLFERKKYYKDNKDQVGASISGMWSYAEGERQDHMVVIRNPLYALINPNIVKLLEFVGELKDRNLVPSEYELGEPFAYSLRGKPIRVQE